MSDIHQRLSVLSVPLRTRILRLVAAEELGVGEIARVVQTPQPTVSRHLKALLDDGWVVRRKVGTSSLYELAPGLGEAEAALWALVSGSLEGRWPDDHIRLTATLAERQDGQHFFGRVAEQWVELRREMFGEGHLIPAIAALLPDGIRVADLGCGPGDLTAHLAEAGARVVAVDREPKMLETAARRVEGLAHVELRRGELEDPPLAAGEVDLALFCLVLHHIADPAKALAAAARALAPGGAIVVLDMVGHDRAEYRRTMGHVHLGFEDAAVKEMAAQAGLHITRSRVLTPQAGATGPALFLARMVPETQLARMVPVTQLARMMPAAAADDPPTAAR